MLPCLILKGPVCIPYRTRKGRGGWTKSEAKSSASTSKHQREDTAVERGRTTAKEIAAEPSIHNLDGTIGRKNSYGGESTVHDKNRRSRRATRQISSTR